MMKRIPEIFSCPACGETSEVIGKSLINANINGFLEKYFTEKDKVEKTEKYKILACKPRCPGFYLIYNKNGDIALSYFCVEKDFIVGPMIYLNPRGSVTLAKEQFEPYEWEPWNLKFCL